MAYIYNKVGLPEFLGPLLEEGTNRQPQDSYSSKIKAMESMIDKANTESQAATEQAGAGSAFGKAIDTAVAPTMRLGNVMLGVNPKNYSNAENIINAYQGAKAKGSEDKLKNLMDTYKTSIAAENALQDYGKTRVDALKGGANALAAMAMTQMRGDNGFRIPASTVVNITDVNAANGMLDNLEKTIEDNKNQFGPISGRVGGVNPYDEKAQGVQSVVDATKQIVGKYLDGGVS